MIEGLPTNRAEATVVKFLRANGCSAIWRGWPDILAADNDGGVGCFEVKASGDRLREDQVKVHEHLRRAGLSVAVVRPDTEDMAETMLTKKGRMRATLFGVPMQSRQPVMKLLQTAKRARQDLDELEVEREGVVQAVKAGHKLLREQTEIETKLEREIGVLRYENTQLRKHIETIATLAVQDWCQPLTGLSSMKKLTP